MPSSTFSSEDRIPAGSWAWTWAGALLLAGAALGALETGWRRAGHEPSVVDSPELWSWHRARVSDGNSETVALLGSSRIQLGISTPEFRACFPKADIRQLAVDGSMPLGTLMHLANDERFKGLAVCEPIEVAFWSRNWYSQQAYLDYYRRKFSWERGLNKRLSVALQEHWVVANPQVRLQKLLEGQWPKPLYLITHADRSRDAHYDRMSNLAEHRRKRVELVLSSLTDRTSRDPEAWLKDALQLEASVKKIQARGGRVVFLRMPTSAEHWAVTEALYPKALFWDRFAERIGAPCIHFKDYPELSDFDCPDTSHLDARDKPRFTSALCQILSGQGLLEAEPPPR